MGFIVVVIVVVVVVVVTGITIIAGLLHGVSGIHGQNGNALSDIVAGVVARLLPGPCLGQRAMEMVTINTSTSLAVLSNL